MDELQRARLEKSIAWAGYFIVLVGALALVFWAWMQPRSNDYDLPKGADSKQKKLRGYRKK
jgi:hypothetical protein